MKQLGRGTPHRTVYANWAEKNADIKDNRVVNSKYTIWNFLLLNLYEQFKYVFRVIRLVDVVDIIYTHTCTYVYLRVRVYMYILVYIYICMYMHILYILYLTA